MTKVCYDEFINNILQTRGRFNCGEEYHEKHHIVPKCMGGTNEEDNLIDLFAHEHYEAHRLLAIENPENDKLQIVWWLMHHHKRDGCHYEIDADEYADIKKRLAQIIGEMHKGRIVSEETRKKQSEAKAGRYDGDKNPMYGVPSPNKGKQISTETRKKQSQSAKARYENLEEHQKSSDAQKKRFERPEERRKVSGENHWLYGKHHSEESRRKMSESQKKRLKNPKDNPMYGVRKFGKDNPRARKTIRLFDLKIYDCMIEAAQDNGMGVDAIRKRCKRHDGFMYYNEWLTLQNDLKQDEV